MKITHVLYLSEVQGRSPFSGAENHLWSLLPALVDEGNDVEFLAVLWRGSNFAKVKQKLSDLATKGIKITVIERGPQKNGLSEMISKLSTWLKLWRCLHERRRNIIHLHLEFVYAPFIAWSAGCRKILYTLHNDEPIFSRMSWRIRLRLLNRIITHYIAITNRVRSYFIEVSGAHPDQVTTVYYGVALPSAPPFTRHEFDIPDDAFVLGFVGRLTEQKNLGVFLDALRQRPNILGVIVGDGPQRDELMHYVEVQQIRNVRFVGAIPVGDRVMPLFNVLCLPSLWEGLGLVLIEAMLRHVPIIGSCRGAIPEILNQGQYGLLVEPTVDGLLQGIDFAFKHPELLRTKAEAAYDYTRERFTMKRMLQGTNDVYRAIDEARIGV